jgi:Leucine-rich repeat (LRR) protein
MINIMVSCGLTSLVAIVAAVVAVVLTRNKSGNETVAPFTSNPTSVPPSPSPTSALFSLLSKKSFDNGAALLTDGSPQQQAMIWLESEPGTTENMDTAKLLQIYALVTLYYATSGDQWLNHGSNDQFVDRSSWLFSINDDCGAWFGLDCNEDETQVISIQLNNNTLKGTLPREIGLLTNLLTLIISYNNFTGTIPTEIGYLTSLTDFEADSNDFNGTLPTEIGYLTGLTIFYVNENQLTGALPSEIGHLTNATVFKIGKNKFTGIIPTEIGLMSALSELFGPKFIFLECLC